ncbi:hypothetical protein Sj15T_24520 [Sphingobium sp. TA15]|uniref:Cell envelope biogenesis protein TolA n=1 Tax=Sphingobium indicum (strain DSM 16413 / CCM 7287 / MTCC 6362 / UT26 / NBRC 101211 / UT26S) TaxID=452662 RepID=D4Z622_SPHIU|nr:hypothetical protein [Sphingobium indicum]BAI98054.1 hypothetical protein SJA_C1-32200 [Sphingobium indicum UT26S]BDD67431.1 hypothetical protein Sj15T_24520 [Sphingobium sp. TA15]
MPRALKTYRTAIGFHDAYVAAPSQKAALEAWGADANLFARGVAEVVTDPALTAEPLAHPGKVIKRPRGSMAEHLAALPAERPAGSGKATARKAAKPEPRPDRAPLDEAEEALAALDRRQEAESRRLARREAALRRERQELEQRHGAERRRLEKARDTAAGRYERALKAWKG